MGPDGDDYWKGTTDSLVVDGIRSTRILIRANQAAIEEAIGNGTLASATLELTVQTAGASWPTGGATVDAHRVLQHWTEAEVTWVCADGHEAWDMSTGSGSIWQAAHTARTTVTNGQTGVVRLNVTADVAAFLGAPQSNHGWLIKRSLEGIGEPGRIAFASRETTPQPRLVIEVASDTTRPAIPPTGPFPADSSLVVSQPGDTVTLFYRNLFAIQFDDGTSGVSIRQSLARLQGEIVGGFTNAREYIVRFPDPGATYQAMDSLRNAIKAEPGVLYAAPMLRRSGYGINARFPQDGLGAGRQDWASTPSAFTASRLAIRLPLAWGCENGRYTTDRMSVGVIDYDFDIGSNDFSASLSPNSLYPLQQAVPVHSRSDLLVAERHAHGTGVAAVMVGSGDNGSDLVGVMWRADLNLFQTLNGGLAPLDMSSYLREYVLPEARRRGVRVLVNATRNIPSDPDHITRIGRALAAYLSDGHLLVVPTGNENQTYTPQELLAIRGSADVGFLQAAVSLVTTTEPGMNYADQIMLVAGTNTITGDRWQFSNVISGVTDIAAPATQIVTLAPQVDYPGARQTQDGTSFAAPFVAGVAAQLWAMDPTLFARDVKQFIVQGAQTPGVPRRNSSGAIVPASPIPSTSIYRLDAYGSVSLLSRTRANTPICGVEVSAPDSRSQTDLEIHRNSLQRFPTARGGRVSVAQGGRRLALGNETLDTTFVYSHTGQLLHFLPGVYQRFYTEKDTVDLQFYMQHLGGFDRDGTRVRRTGPTGFVDWFDPADRARETATRWFDGGVLPSPDGEWVVLWANYDMTTQCSNQPNLYAHFRILLVPLGSAGFTALHANVRQGAGQSCAPQGDPADQFENFSAAWRPTADSLVLAFPRFGTAGQFLQSRFEIRAAVANSPPGTTGSASAFVNIWSMEPDGVRLRTVQSAAGGGGCEFRRVLAASPFTDLASEPGCVQFEDEVDRVLPTLRASRRIAARAATGPRD